MRNKSHQTARAPETKAATGNAQEVAESFEEFMEAFEAFKQANDERLEQVESRIGADTVTVEKMNRISRALDEQKSRMDGFVLKGQRPGFTGSAALTVAGIEHNRLSTPMYAAATSTVCASTNKKRFPTAPILTAGFWCQTKQLPRLAGDSHSLPRSAR